MPRAPIFTEIDEPCVVRQPYLGRYQGRSRVIVSVRCPECLGVRERTATEIRKEALRTNFKGYCRPCALAAVTTGKHRWCTSESRKAVRGTASNGYHFIRMRDVPDALLPMYRTMQRGGQPVLHHRWTMAVHLGRPLTSTELVDHMNGDKGDNTIENLRIYVRGKQQPGSAPGHGTYYHEWQMALRRIAELEGR